MRISDWSSDVCSSDLFVTEELWQAVAPKLGKSGSIMVQPYPQAGDIDVAAYARPDADIQWLKALVSAVRRIRSELGVSPSKQVSLLVSCSSNAAGHIARPASQLPSIYRLDQHDPPRT